MKYEDFCKQIEIRERIPNQKNDLIAEEIILKYLQKVRKNRLFYQTAIL